MVFIKFPAMINAKPFPHAPFIRYEASPHHVLRVSVRNNVLTIARQTPQTLSRLTVHTLPSATSPTKLGCISPSSGGVSGAPPIPLLPLKLPLALKHTLPFLPPNSSSLILLLPRSSSSLNDPTSSSFSFHRLSTACLSLSSRRSSSSFSFRISARTASRPAFAAASS